MRAMDFLTVAEVVHELKLTPHSEGGFFRETHRSVLESHEQIGTSHRAACTVIYFLIARDQNSRWHKVDADEIWFWHAGSDLELSIVDPSTGGQTVLRIGTSGERHAQPHGAVPPGWWQSARTLGDWTLVSCVVAPGFEWSKFTLAPTEWSPSSIKPE